MAVFITDGLLRKALSAARSLGEQNISVTVGEKIRWTPSGFSAFCQQSVRYPDPNKKRDSFKRWLIQHLNDKKYDLYLPMDDAAVEAAIDIKDDLQQLTSVVLPPKQSYHIARDKLKTVRLAQQAGISCPETYMIHSIEELEGLVNQLHYPVIIKPRTSSGSRGIKKVNSASECLEHYHEIHHQYEFPMIQEYIPTGPRYDVCFLYNLEGELRAQFVQKELRHYPIDMGPSTVQESVDYPDLIEIGLQLMKHLPWFGVIELEFMIDHRDGQPKLMEINPRFWNSLECAKQSGVNFPYLLYKMAAEGDVDPVTTYHSGVQCSNILPGDILHFMFNKNRNKMDPPFLLGMKKGVRDDILTTHDPLPTWGFLLASMRYLFDVEMWRLLFNRGG